MAVPDYKSFINPILGFMHDKRKDNSVTLSEILDFLKKEFNPSPEDLQEQIQNGTPKFNHRMNWAVADLLHAKLVERVARGVYRISDRGIQLLNENPHFDFHTLMEIPEYVEYRRPKVSKKTKMIKNQIESQEEEDAETPQERIESLYKELETRTKEAILERLKACDADQFEHISLKLLEKLGYGVGAIEHLGGSHDEGVDGVKNQDFLGLDKIYIQAKKYNKGTVDSSKIREFVGALEGKSNKGVLLTTSSFTKDAVNWIRKVSNKSVVLIDGKKMADLMFQKNLGVEITKTFEIKKVREDFFTEDIDVE